MMISNQENTYLPKRMNTIKNIAPVRRNVARQSTSNRPLPHTIVKETSKDFKKDDSFYKEKMSPKLHYIKTYPNYDSSELEVYFNDDNKNTSNRSFVEVKQTKNKDPFIERGLIDVENDDILRISDESDEEDTNLSGVFCVSDAMARYLDDSILSPPVNYDSSDESIDLTRVRNYPVKIEKNAKSEPPCSSLIPCKNILPSKEIVNTSKNIKQEVVLERNHAKPIPIITSDSQVSDESNITVLGTQTKKCLFDPDLEDVTCKVKLREEDLVCENFKGKMTILEANFDVQPENNIIEHLENQVDESDYNPELENAQEESSNVPQLICAVSLGNMVNNESEEAPKPQTLGTKKTPKKTKKVSSKSTEKKVVNIVTNNLKRMTRSQMQGVTRSRIKRRITRNSARLNFDSVMNKDCEINSSENNNCIDEEQMNNNDKVLSEDVSKENVDKINTDQKDVFSTAVENIEGNNSDTSKEEKSDSKKKIFHDKKSKKEINEGVLLHVEATKETDLMRDGKIIKDKEELLKDIESKIDKNLPVVVEKEFDIQQSLTEEILLDQVLRSAHQRTSPRLSRIMKEAILKASVKKTNSKSKQSRVNANNKTDTKSKGNNIVTSHRNSHDETEGNDCTVTSESASDISSNLDLPLKDIDSEKNPKRKTDYVVAPAVKTPTIEEIVEPITIKISRKTNKKRAGFRLSLKKKKNLKKKEAAIHKPLCSNAVNMDDLSKTFEDILQDDNWCSDKSSISTNSIHSLVPSSIDSSKDKNICSGNEVKSSIVHDEISSSKNINDKIPLNNSDVDKFSEENGQNSDVPKNTDESEMVSATLLEEKRSESGVNTIPLLVDNSSQKNISKISASCETESDSVKINEGNKENRILNENTCNETMSAINTTNNNHQTVNDNVPIEIDSSKSPEEKPNKSPTSTNLESPNDMLKTLGSSTSKTHSLNTSDSTINHNLLTSVALNDTIQKNINSIAKDLASKPIFPTNIVAKHSRNSYNQENQFVNNFSSPNRDVSSQFEQSKDQSQFPVPTPSTDIQPKVLPLSIASRDPRLRKSHVRVIVEVSTSSVSSPPIEKADMREETRMTSQVIENISKETVVRQEVDSDQEVNENHLEIERKKKAKRKEVDAELLYKTPLSDLHEVAERSSYSRSVRKRTPPKNDKRDPRNVRRKEINALQSTERGVTEPFREYHEISTIYSKSTIHEPVHSEMPIAEEFKGNEGYSNYRRTEHYRTETHHSEHFNGSYRNDEYPTDIRKRDSLVQSSSSEYIHEARHSREFSERRPGYHNHPDHRRSSHFYKDSDEEYRRSENYPPEQMPPDSYNRFKRSGDFGLVHAHREPPDFREKEIGRERIPDRSHISRNEPSYSRWDYAHKKLEGHFPPEFENDSKKNDESAQPDDINMWEEERDLIDGPVKSFSRPFYRRKKFSRGEELFERRNVHWDADNRRYPEENERLWVRKTDKELIHGPDRERWDRRSRKGYREERSRSPRRDHDRFTGKRSRSPRNYIKNRRESSPSPRNSPVVLDSPMSPEPADRICVLEPLKCLTVPQ